MNPKRTAEPSESCTKRFKRESPGDRKKSSTAEINPGNELKESSPKPSTSTGITSAGVKFTSGNESRKFSPQPGTSTGTTCTIVEFMSGNESREPSPQPGTSTGTTCGVVEFPSDTESRGSSPQPCTSTGITCSLGREKTLFAYRINQWRSHVKYQQDDTDSTSTSDSDIEFTNVFSDSEESERPPSRRENYPNADKPHDEEEYLNLASVSLTSENLSSSTFMAGSSVPSTKFFASIPKVVKSFPCAKSFKTYWTTKQTLNVYDKNRELYTAQVVYSTISKNIYVTDDREEKTYCLGHYLDWRAILAVSLDSFNEGFPLKELGDLIKRHQNDSKEL